MSESSDALAVEEAFRDANRRIMAVADSLSVDADVPFLCECSDTNCRELIRMPWTEFDALHEVDNLFVVVPGHELLEVEQLVAESDRYNVVKK